MDETLWLDDGVPEGDICFGIDGEIITITEANSYDPGPSEAHRKRLEKKYGRLKPPREDKDKTLGDPPPA
jgi:hypothetical protein